MLKPIKKITTGVKEEYKCRKMNGIKYQRLQNILLDVCHKSEFASRNHNYLHSCLKDTCRVLRKRFKRVQKRRNGGNSSTGLMKYLLMLEAVLICYLNGGITQKISISTILYRRPDVCMEVLTSRKSSLHIHEEVFYYENGNNPAYLRHSFHHHRSLQN